MPQKKGGSVETLGIHSLFYSNNSFSRADKTEKTAIVKKKKKNVSLRDQLLSLFPFFKFFFENFFFQRRFEQGKKWSSL
jgi:hypothetical protein